MIVTSVYRIGYDAYANVQVNESGQIFGRTSRGDFILLADHSIIFLSFEKFAGPLTVNIRRDPACCARLQVGDPIQISAASLTFLSCPWALSLAGLEPWLPPSPNLPALSHPDILDNLKALALEIFQVKPPGPVSGWLSAWLELPLPPSSHKPDAPDLFALRSHLAAGDGSHLMNFLFSQLGRGEGLTPSGDDLILGFLLAGSRWNMHTENRPFFAETAALLATEADQKTTRLSAGLIQCAANGRADERLVAALDGVVTGGGNLAHLARQLAGWGNHSGADAMTGMALYLLTL